VRKNLRVSGADELLKLYEGTHPKMSRLDNSASSLSERNFSSMRTVLN
jgi:hypothetical protein